MKQLFTADWHLDHKKIMFLCKRPFEDVNHMGRVFFENLEKVREPGDILYFLGDLSLTSKYVEGYLDQFRAMRVQLCFIFGNHDEGSRNKIKNHPVVTWSGDLKDIKLRAREVWRQRPNKDAPSPLSDIGDSMWAPEQDDSFGPSKESPLLEWPVMLGHYPMRSWNRSTHGARHLHGHSHGAASEWRNCLDVGVDSAFHLLGEYRPFTAQEVKDQIDRINKEVQF